jgi:hypothetical protein
VNHSRWDSDTVEELSPKKLAGLKIKIPQAHVFVVDIEDNGPRVGADNQWQTLQTAILRTIKPIPSWKQQADAWLTVNGLCGDALLDEFTNVVAGGQSFSVGGFAYVPHKVDPWQQLSEITVPCEEKLSVFAVQLP